MACKTCKLFIFNTRVIDFVAYKLIKHERCCRKCFNMTTLAEDTITRFGKLGVSTDVNEFTAEIKRLGSKLVYYEDRGYLFYFDCTVIPAEPFGYVQKDELFTVIYK